MPRLIPLVILVVIINFITVPHAWSQYKLVDAFPGLHIVDPAHFQQGPDGRYYVVELDGRIVSFETGDRVNEVLDIRPVVDRSRDGGLYSIAFHPEFTSNRLFFINYISDDPLRKIVARYTMDEDGDAVPESAEILLEIPLLTGGHNGGTLAFGPDGYLYLATGDGNCCTGDEHGHGQNTATLPGAFLRLDVDHPSGGRPYGVPADNPFVGQADHREEIYAYGFRNPWRFSFDSETGDLWAADVGEYTKEEINLVERGKNYGWNILEGTHCFDEEGDCARDDLMAPVFDYGRDEGGSVIGGYVYRGTEAPGLVGQYVYADWVSGRIWALNPETRDTTLLMETPHRIVTFGVDQADELYLVTIGGVVYQIVPATTSSLEVIEQHDFEFHHYPNPAPDRISLEYTLPSSAHVSLEIYNVLGERVRTLISTVQAVGRQQTTWDGRDDSGRMVASGIYYYRLNVADRIGAAGPLSIVR